MDLGQCPFSASFLHFRLPQLISHLSPDYMCVFAVYNSLRSTSGAHACRYICSSPRRPTTAMLPKQKWPPCPPSLQVPLATQFCLGGASGAPLLWRWKFLLILHRSCASSHSCYEFMWVTAIVTSKGQPFTVSSLYPGFYISIPNKHHLQPSRCACTHKLSSTLMWVRWSFWGGKEDERQWRLTLPSPRNSNRSLMWKLIISQILCLFVSVNSLLGLYQ